MWIKTVEYSHNFKPQQLTVKNEIRKCFLILCFWMYVLSNDTTHNSLRWTYRSAKIDWTKKPNWVYSSSLPTNVGIGTIIGTLRLANFCFFPILSKNSLKRLAKTNTIFLEWNDYLYWRSSKTHTNFCSRSASFFINYLKTQPCEYQFPQKFVTKTLFQRKITGYPYWYRRHQQIFF